MSVLKEHPDSMMIIDIIKPHFIVARSSQIIYFVVFLLLPLVPLASRLPSAKPTLLVASLLAGPLLLVGFRSRNHPLCHPSQQLQ